MVQSEPHAPATVDKVVREDEFLDALASYSLPFFELLHALQAQGHPSWSKQHYHQLVHDAHHLESFLDDYGARSNRTFHGFRELIAGLRWLAAAGHSVVHLSGRLDSYGARRWPDAEVALRTRERVARTAAYLGEHIGTLLCGVEREAADLGLRIPSGALPENKLLPVEVRRQLPRNLGADEPQNEDQRIAEVASKFLQATDLLLETGARPIADAGERRSFLEAVCTEEQARVYQATVHNLQSTYDTYIRNTVIEAKDGRLPHLRGHASAALHLLEAVTNLVHFRERHESDARSSAEESVRKLGDLVPPDELDQMILEELLLGAVEILEAARPIAADLLPSYTNVKELSVELADGVSLHARPAALIVGIVNHYATPVEMEVEGHTCNAASILELLVAVGSHPEARCYLFRGDERPLKDVQLLFEHKLGERQEGLPPELDYLRG